MADVEMAEDKQLSALMAFRNELLSHEGSVSMFRAQHQDLLTSGASEALAEASPELSAKRRFSRPQLITLWSIGVLILIAALFSFRGVLVGLNAVFILYGLALCLFRLSLVANIIREARPRRIRNTEPLSDDALPVITVLCPLYKEEESLPNLLGALDRLDYPREKLDIKIVLEADDEITRKAAAKACKPGKYDVVIVPEGQPKTKPKACNFALWSARGDYIVIYDAEDRPARDQLRRAAEAFAVLPPTVACLQARLNYYNREASWLTRIFAAEYAYIFDILLPGLTSLGAPLPLGGTSNIFRTEALLAIGGWDPHNVTEDADIGMRLAAKGYTSRMLDTTTLEEATNGLGAWFRQRTRWIKGYMQSWAVHSRYLPKSPAHALTLPLVIGGVIVASLFNPIFWVLYIVWLSGIVDLDWLFPAPLGALATIGFLAGNLILLWLYMLAPMRRRWHDLVPYALTSPAYWVLQMAAGYRAAWQFITSPHYWEKTEHGAGLAHEEIAERDLEAST